ncbi:MAG: sugar phosphate isomerase/epimerase [Blastochloris sp.]|nr:sugar phosphate isomerase/epimerase [Blastochloris sp.]
MQLKLVRHLWGVAPQENTASLLRAWRDLGYEALEAPHCFLEPLGLSVSQLRRQGWGWIEQINTQAPDLQHQVQDHLRSLETALEKGMMTPPDFFNLQGGHDAWELSQAIDFYGGAQALEKRFGLPICHETHRSRFFSTPWNTLTLLRHFPALKLTCDYSHWVCVCERLLPDVQEALCLSAQHAWHLHARVGYEQGPQVPDPRDPVWAPQLAAHERWWDAIWQAQRSRGLAQSTLTPKFGPPPYQHTRPHSGEPLADLSALCDWMAQRQHQRFIAA